MLLFNFSCISLDAELSTIKHLSSALFASGSDYIPLFSVSKAPFLIDSFSTRLFNGCNELRNFLLIWKYALIKSLLKVKFPITPSDTRPLANFREFSKIHERIIHRQITDFITAHTILVERKSGYHSGFSTQTALLRIIHDIKYSIDKGKVTVSVLFDFSKAFDTVPHCILLLKLRGFSDCALQ